MIKKVLIIVPAYNEAEVIGQTLESLEGAQYDVLVVDDGSTDATSNVAGQFDVSVISHVRNMGQGAAIRTGFAYALSHKYDAVVTFDADGQHAVENIEMLIDWLEEKVVDICLGTRFGSTVSAIPWKRKALLQCARWVDFAFSGILLSDSHNGLRAIRTEALKNMVLLSDRMEHASEIIWEVKRLHLKYHEVPVMIYYRRFAHKKGQSLANALRIFFSLMVLKKKRFQFFKNGNGN
ncbi:MAG: glycosyltransferase family 2 protein [Saprospiraceae bacterium]|nr:glycosyltransferase family 2 protein [Saprospiraceae bacterium]